MEIKNLKRLKSLRVCFNRLTELPSEIGHLSALEILDVSNNDISKICQEIGSCLSLEELDISANPVTHIPASIVKLSKLTKLKLNGTQVVDTFLKADTKKIIETISELQTELVPWNTMKLLFVGDGGVGT
jgi:Leucine-rich repeat (LRR) protein